MDRTDPDAAIEHTAGELEHDLETLDEHIGEAKSKEQAYEQEFPAAATPAGDVSGQEGGPMFGEDASGADDDGDAREQARES